MDAMLAKLTSVAERRRSMPKQKHFRAIEWIKERTPGWSPVHTALDLVVGQIFSLVFAFAVCLAGSVITILAQLATLSTPSQLLLFFFLIGTSVSGVKLWRQPKSLRPLSKPEQRVAELIDEAADIRDAKSAATWLNGVRSFFGMVGEWDLARGFDEEDNLLRSMLVVEDFDGDVLKGPINVLKNYAATHMKSGD